MRKIIVLLFLFVFCITSYGSSDKIIKYNLEDFPITLNPTLCTDSTSGEVLAYIFEGLTSLDSKGKPIPAVAESWTTNNNIWTFKLRKSAKWQNGEPVTAKDFVNGWEKVLNPDNGAQYAYIMYCIKGAQEYNEGINKDFSSVGVRALDDMTLEVTLKESVTYFPSLLSFYTFYPLNLDFFKKNSEDYGSSKETILGNGAFILNQLSYNNDKIIMKKSENYWNKNNVNINGIEMLIIDDKEALELYKNGYLDVVGVSSLYINDYEKSKDLKKTEDGTVWYLNLNHEIRLFSNKKIRQAFSMAIDRNAMIKVIKNNLGTVAESFVPNGIYGKKDFFRAENNQSLYNISFNPKKANQLFDEGLKELNIERSEIGKITLLSGNSNIAVMEALFYSSQLKIVLNLDCALDLVDFKTRLDKISARDYDIAIGGWGADYNDPMTFLDLWTSSSDQNYSGWANKEYDALIHSATLEKENSKRIDILAKAEKLLMEELPIIPTYYRTRAFLIKPNIKDVNFQLFSPQINFLNSFVE